MTTLTTLPTELQHQILTHLPLPTLLTFARTSKHNYVLSTTALTTLNLAVFPKRIHGILSFINTAETFDDTAALNQIAVASENASSSTSSKGSASKRRDARFKRDIAASHLARSAPRFPAEAGTLGDRTILPVERTPKRARHASILSQNELLAKLLCTPSLQSLHDLSLSTTAMLDATLTSTLASRFPELRHLSLNFSHPCIHESYLPARYWRTTPFVSDEGTPAWNALAGIGAENREKLKLRELRSLEVVRAAITERQCLEWVRRNPGLRKVRLQMVTGVDNSFVHGLAALAEEGESRTGLQVLQLENCGNLILKTEEEMAWIEKMVKNGLKELSFRECEGVDGEMLARVSEERKWGDRGLKLTMPEEEEGETRSCGASINGGEEGKGKGRVLEVDPEYA